MRGILCILFITSYEVLRFFFNSSKVVDEQCSSLISEFRISRIVLGLDKEEFDSGLQLFST